VAERLGELAREEGTKLRERRSRLDVVERDIAKLIDFIIESTGTASASPRTSPEVARNYGE